MDSRYNRYPTAESAPTFAIEERPMDEPYTIKEDDHRADIKDLSLLLTKLFGSASSISYRVLVERRQDLDGGYIATVVDAKNNILPYQSKALRCRYAEETEDQAVSGLVDNVQILVLQRDVEEYERKLKDHEKAVDNYKYEVRENHRSGMPWVVIITRTPKKKLGDSRTEKRYCESEIKAWECARTCAQTDYTLIVGGGYKTLPKKKLLFGIHVEKATGHRRKKPQ